MIDRLKQWDQELFLWLNDLNQPWLDEAMMLLTDEWPWIPLHLLILFLIYKSYNLRIALFSLLGVALVVTLGDRISVELFKEVFQRYRPTHNLEIGDLVHTVNGYKGGLYGFVSSHATNYFGISTFLYFLISDGKKFSAWWLFIWAGFVSYTRIYLGVHYPGDIAVGAILGFVIGYLVYALFNRFIIRKN
jgi:undecaprenyl-diphosphatase